jgi:hypothetical protein
MALDIPIILWPWFFGLLGFAIIGAIIYAYLDDKP